MQYFGGKGALGAELAAQVAPQGWWWEPFCGGLNVSKHLAAHGPGLVSDGNAALINLYRAIRAGWLPPTDYSRLEYKHARSLPDTDPSKAFMGIACSFSGKWFGGWRKEGRVVKRFDGTLQTKRPQAATALALQEDVGSLKGCALACLHFFKVNPCTAPAPECIYADPPYEGCAPYAAMEPFNSALFWTYCQAWAARGTRVFVSEYTCSVPHELAWERPVPVYVQGGARKDGAVERLFRVLPDAQVLATLQRLL